MPVGIVRDAMNGFKKYYAIEMRKPDLALLTILNGGEPVEIPKPGRYWFVVEVAPYPDNSSKFEPSSKGQIMKHRDFINEYDFSTAGPLFVRVRKP